MEIELDSSVNHRIAMVATLLKRQVFRIIAENKLEITPEQWVIMYYLWGENGLSVGELAARSRKDFANTTRIINKLQKSGYVAKRRSENDSRSSNIYILPKADKIKDKVKKVWIESINVATKGIDKSEQQHLLIILDKIENNILEKLK